jgi:Fe-S-cluster containining protein
LTHHDLARILARTALSVDALVEWLAPDDVDMSGEPESFVELNWGRRLLVLRHEGDGCRFLAPEGHCRIYDERPASCAAYPFTLEREGTLEPAPLALLHDAPCDLSAAWSRLQDQDAESEARRAVERVESELRDYVARVAEWNRQQRRRKWLRRLPQRDADFMTFLGVKALT